jgi:hypothetical protein
VPERVLLVSIVVTAQVTTKMGSIGRVSNQRRAGGEVRTALTTRA